MSYRKACGRRRLTVALYVHCLSYLVSEGTEKNNETLSQDSRSGPSFKTPDFLNMNANQWTATVSQSVSQVTSFCFLRT